MVEENYLEGNYLGENHSRENPFREDTAEETTMEEDALITKTQLDIIYSDLRSIHNVWYKLPKQDKEALSGLVTHLFTPNGNYGALMRFLDFYGRFYTAPLITNVIKTSGIYKPGCRFVDIGAGSGWLSRHLDATFENKTNYANWKNHTLRVDKRQWAGIDIVADVESENGISRVLDCLEPSDILVFSETLHCIDNPATVLHKFAAWPIIISEYYPMESNWYNSYVTQLRNLGVHVCSLQKLMDTLTSTRDIINTGKNITHLVYILSEEKKPE